MSDIEAENKNLKEEQSEVSAPTEIGAPSVGSKDIRWYVIHTYSGYENKVKDTLTRKVHSMGMDDTILEILLPLQDEEEEKDGKTRVVAHKVFPGYLLIKMEVNDRSWYVVRNTPGVTGFVGTTTKPIPLSDEEADRIIHGMNTRKQQPSTSKPAIASVSPRVYSKIALLSYSKSLKTRPRSRPISAISEPPLRLNWKPVLLNHFRDSIYSGTASN